MRRFFVLTLGFALIITVFAGCAQENEGPYIPTGDGLTWDEVTTPTYCVTEQIMSLAYYPARSLNPYEATDLTNRTLFGLVYQSLFVVDAAGELLKQVLPYHPFLIKPNRQELGAFFDVEIESVEDVIPYAGKLQEMGARNVLVSMGGEGAVLLDEYRNVHRLEVPKGKPVNAVGAGDSMGAGFLAGWMERQDYSHAFRLSVAAGSASTFSEQLASGAQIRTLYETWDADRQTGE